MAFAKFGSTSVGANILRSYAGTPSAASTDQVIIDDTCRKAAIALGVGCWEGYIEGVLRVQTHRRNWTLIAQFEVMVDKKAAILNTPNWDQTRDLLIEITGTDPYSAWVWQPKFANPSDTKAYFDGIMTVRHAFAHGFPIPHGIIGLATPGTLDDNYVNEALSCLEFFVRTTDSLLEHELRHRHSCQAGWN
jgi:hypothetical protein